MAHDGLERIGVVARCTTGIDRTPYNPKPPLVLSQSMGAQRTAEGGNNEAKKLCRGWGRSRAFSSLDRAQRTRREAPRAPLQDRQSAALSSLRLPLTPAA
jgi:hypothetical protein